MNSQPHILAMLVTFACTMWLQEAVSEGKSVLSESQSQDEQIRDLVLKLRTEACISPFFDMCGSRLNARETEITKALVGFGAPIGPHLFPMLTEKDHIKRWSALVVLSSAGIKPPAEITMKALDLEQRRLRIVIGHYRAIISDAMGQPLAQGVLEGKPFSALLSGLKTREHIEYLIENGLKKDDVRFDRALHALVYLKASEAVPTLEKRLSTTEGDRKLQILSGLARIWSKEARAVLRRQLLVEHDLDVPDALKGAGDEGLGLLSDGCRSESLPVAKASLRSFASRAYNLKDRVLPYLQLFEELTASSDAEIRSDAIVCLRWSRDPKAGRILRPLLKHQELRTRASAAGAMEYVLDPALTDDLVNLLTDREATVVANAVRSLWINIAKGKIGHPKKDEVFLRILSLQQHISANVRKSVMWACYGLGSDTYSKLDEHQIAQSRDLSIRFLSDQDQDVRLSAIRYVTDRRIDDSRPVLLTLLRHEDELTESRALHSLAVFLEPKAIPRAIELLSTSKDTNLLSHSLLSLELFGKATLLTEEQIGQAVPQLGRLLRSPMSNIRYRARAAMVATKSPLAASLLVESLRVKIAGGQNADEAVVKLGAIAVPHLVVLVEGSNLQACRRALVVLSKLGAAGREAGPTVLYAARHEDRDVRRNALWALRKMDMAPAQLVPVYMNALRDSDRTIRLESIYALGILGSAAKGATAAITKFQSLQDDDFRKAAEYALEKIRK